MAIERWGSSSDELLPWDDGAPVWAVERQQRVMRAVENTMAREAAHNYGLARELALRGRNVVKKTTMDIYADQDTITDPRVRQVMQVVDQRYIDLHAKHQEAFYRLACEQFALQMSRDITPKQPQPDSFWQQLALSVFGG